MSRVFSDELLEAVPPLGWTFAPDPRFQDVDPGDEETDEDIDEEDDDEWDDEEDDDDDLDYEDESDDDDDLDDDE